MCDVKIGVEKREEKKRKEREHTEQEGRKTSKMTDNKKTEKWDRGKAVNKNKEEKYL